MSRNKRPTLDDFPIGCTVKLIHLPKSHWRVKGKYPDLVGYIGTVIKHYPREEDSDGPWVEVSFDPIAHTGSVFRPWWLQRGRIEWIPEVGA